MKINPFRAVMPDLSRIVSKSEAFFDTVKEQYADQKSVGLFLTPDADLGFYCYRLDAADRSFWGLVACVDLHEYLENRIKKHENTIVVSEKKQADLLAERGAAIKPVLLAFMPPPQYPTDFFQDFCQKNTQNTPPVLSVDLNETHLFWKISDIDQIQILQKYFDQINSAYIADGHHRCAASALLYKNAPTETNRWLFSAFFPVEELKINEFNRVLMNLNTAEQFGIVESIRQICDIEPLKIAEKPRSKFEFCFVIQQKWFRATWKSEIIEHFSSKNPNLVLLDVHLLNEKIFKQILNIKNIRKSDRIKYVEGTRGLAALAKETTDTGGVGFALFPVAFQDLKAVSDSDGTMPPKSTFFEPRMKNGLLVYEI